MNFARIFALSIGVAVTSVSSLSGNAHAFEAVEKEAPKKTVVQRQDSLDHWDSDTLSYYFDNYPGYDLAVMFYATWDNNSHRLAPIWNQIAVMLDAGTTQSNLIMALFDCELNTVHMKMCESLGITHYPTMTFIGSGPFYDNDPISKILFGKKSGGHMGESPVPNTVKYQGNWQYPDSILDWIKTMQALSRWHTWSTEGFGKRLRTFFLPRRQKNEQLPVGVPGGGSISSSTSSDANTAFLEEQVGKYKKSTEDMKLIASKAVAIIQNVLFHENSTDMFALLDERDNWKKHGTYENLDDIHRACVIETSVDYCEQLADPVGKKVVDELLAANLSSEELTAASENIEQLLSDEIAKTEPYCAIIESCITTDFKEKACRPKTCPFNNMNACYMLNSCQETLVVKEYAEALKLDMDALLL